MSQEGRLNLGRSPVPKRPYSGKVGFRGKPQITLAEANECRKRLHDLIDQDFKAIRDMHELAYGGKPPAQDPSQRANGKPPPDLIGPPTPLAWGEVPNDTTQDAALAGRRYSGAYRSMTRSFLRMETSATNILGLEDRVLGEARTHGSPLPDMRADKLGKVEYERLLEAQERRERGEA